jgi:DNA modification methylase
MDYTLYHGDCLVEMDKIETGSIDMVLADLPYGSTQCSWDSPIDLVELWKQYIRVIKDNGAILLFAQTPFDKVLGVSNLRLLRYEWIWEKTEATGHLNCKRMPMKSHENVLVFYKRLPTYNPQITTGHSAVHSFNKTVVVQNNTTVYGKVKHGSIGDNRTWRYPRDIVKFSTDKQKMKGRGKLHPTQKPVALLEYFINTYTNVGETVLDNVMGSGSTGVACANIGRNFIGIELFPLPDLPIDRVRNPNYFFNAKEWIEEFHK